MIENFASCLRDCASALAPPLPSPSSPTIRKSLFRSARASYQLGKLDDAIDALERLRTLDEKEGRGVDKDGEALRKKVEDRRVQKMKQEEEKKRRENADKAFGSSLRAAFEVRPSTLSVATSLTSLAEPRSRHPQRSPLPHPFLFPPSQRHPSLLRPQLPPRRPHVRHPSTRHYASYVPRLRPPSSR